MANNNNKAITLSEVVGEKVISSAQKGGLVSTKSLLGPQKYIGLYFSAHWCPPCRDFTPKLIDFYLKVRAAGKQFEIIFVSADRDEASFKEYFEIMPWHAMVYDEENPEPREHAMDKFSIQGIPALVVFDGSTEVVITKSGREELEKDPEGKSFPWKKK